jgi:hypothetical protein
MAGGRAGGASREGIAGGVSKRKKAWPKPSPFSLFLFVVPVTGIELVTFALRMRCSTN